MLRKLRIGYPGAMYYVINRGDQCEDIFQDDEDRQKFLTTLGEACVETEWQFGQEMERLRWDEEQLRRDRSGTGRRCGWRAASARRCLAELTFPTC